MKVKKQIISREDVEKYIQQDLCSNDVIITTWMWHIGLNSTETCIYALLYKRLRMYPMRELYVPTKELCDLLNISEAQCNNITRKLNRLGFIYKRVEDKKSYYSLYKNLLSA